MVKVDESLPNSHTHIVYRRKSRRRYVQIVPAPEKFIHLRRIAAVLALETPVPGVTDLQPAPNLKGLAELTVGSRDIPVPTGADRNVRTPNLSLNPGWGRTQRTKTTGEIVMPGYGNTTPG